MAHARQFLSFGENRLGLIAVKFRAVGRESCIAERLALIGRFIGNDTFVVSNCDPLHYNSGGDIFPHLASSGGIFPWKIDGSCGRGGGSRVERNEKIEEEGKQLKRE